MQDKELISAHFDRIAAQARSVPSVALDYPRR
jgi:hypothetical protein